MINHTKHLLDKLFNFLESNNVSYCILHGYETLPKSTPSDVDIAIDPRQRKNLDTLIYQLASETGFIVTQKLYYDVPHCDYYVLCHASRNNIVIVQLDFLMDHLGVNSYYFKTEELLKGRKRYKNFYVPETSTEFIYLLLKKFIKGKFYQEHQIRLKELYLSDPKNIEENILRYFGRKNLPIIRNIIMGNEQVSKKSILSFRRYFLKKYFSPLKRFQKIFWLTKRVISRIKNPTGMFVVVLSPDGGGKTSVANGILQNLRLSFRRTKYLYWRPGVLPEIRDLLRLRFKRQEGRINPDPHGREEQGTIISYIRFIYYTFDYLLGYFQIRFLKTITTLVVMDRYYYDFIVDRKRYGFKIPDWLPKLFSKIIPKPDLVIYLDNEPEKIYTRKQELPLKELKRQIEKFRELIPEIPNAYTINTNKSLEEVIHESSKYIIKTKAQMLNRLLNID